MYRQRVPKRFSTLLFQSMIKALLHRHHHIFHQGLTERRAIIKKYTATAFLIIFTY